MSKDKTVRLVQPRPDWLVVGAIVIEKYKPRRVGFRYRVQSCVVTRDPTYLDGWKVTAMRLFPRPNGKPWVRPACFFAEQLEPAPW